MPRIFDNIKGDSLAKALNQTLVGAKRADFCIGYFNLRGWDLLLDSVDALPGAFLDEKYEDADLSHKSGTNYKARILIGMPHTQQEELEELYSLDKTSIDMAQANELKKKAAADFRKQLTLGLPTNRDEATLKALCRQLRSGQAA
ncbi:MAG: hypothetical protein LBG84_01570, partial [Treponema sp.]|nr:hypothetical protein [Treponema sp.]